MPEYNNLAYWAAHPWKRDPSDSLPIALKKVTPDSLADVFFLHPTSHIKDNDMRWNAPFDDAEINAETDYRSVLYQASAFANKTRVFAPRYRQAHVRAYHTLDTARAAEALEFAYQDVKKAFAFYLTHYNKGRPIIIASHSQGTTHALKLMKEFFDDKAIANQLVCAYLVGMPVPENFFEKIIPCKDSTSTGCFTSWRTYQKGYEGTSYVVDEKFKSVVTNPLTWTTGNEYAPASLNNGGLLLNFNKIIPGVTDAKVHKNILWSSKPKFFGNIFLRIKNYHIADINFFYMNIRQNVYTRIKAYNAKSLE